MDNEGAHKKECVKEIINKTKNTLYFMQQIKFTSYI